jgi:hypothetical protein
LTLSSVLIARQYSIEYEELHNLNRIYANPNAKVAVGDKQADKILNHIAKFKKHEDSSSESDNDE